MEYANFFAYFTKKPYLCSLKYDFMKKILLLLLPFLVACTSSKDSPFQPEQPSYIGLPIVTYTVLSKDNIHPSGEVPIGSRVAFESTYNRRSQLIAGTSATLTLSGVEGIKIRSITLHMHSNKSSGAGSLVVTNGSTPVWTIDNAAFNTRSWHGTYTTDTASVFHLFTTPLECTDQLQITITASVNSLYILRYDIEYEPALGAQTKRDESLSSGLKIITFWDDHRLTGPINGKYVKVQSDTLPIMQEDLYWVEFFEDTVATIQHYVTGSFIGFCNGDLSTIATRWNVVQHPDTSLTFYTLFNDRYYSLLPDPNNDLNCFIQAHNSLFKQHWVLYSVVQ